MRSKSFCARMHRLASLVVAACLLQAPAGHADPVPPATELPQKLTLAEALRIFRTRGLDLLIADAAIRDAEGDVQIAGSLPNPTVSGSVGNAITYADTSYGRQDCLRSGASCTPWIFNVGINENAALVGWLSGKRALRLRVARNALAAAKLQRADAERTLGFEVRAAYLEVVQSVLGYAFAKEVAASNATTLAKFLARYGRGAISQGELQRMETQKLESEQQLDSADAARRQARVALAFLLGVRGAVPDFDVDTNVLDYSVPAALKDATEVELLRVAFAHRPDLIALGYSRASAEAQIKLTSRSRFPDLAIGVNYSWGGFGGLSTNGPVGPQVLTFGLSGALPIFYQLQGEQRQAQARYDTASLQQARMTAQVSNEVATAYAAFTAARRRVERMEGPRRPGGGLVESAKGAFEVTAYQYEKGAASLTDYLDALRTYVTIKMEYFENLTSYWTAAYRLDAAVGAAVP